MKKPSIIEDVGHAFYMGTCVIYTRPPLDIRKAVWDWLHSEFPAIADWAKDLPVEAFDLSYATHVRGETFLTMRVYLLVKGIHAVDFKLKWVGDKACWGTFENV